jgi:glycosyltransferase involved in cell wall biosynthesis
MQKLSKDKQKVFIKYVPHGINPQTYFPTDVPDEFKREIFGNKEYEFVLYWSNRNIRRKQPSDVIYAYKMFCEEIGWDAADRTCLLMHTQPVDENGTDLPAVIKAVAPKCNIIFSDKRREQRELNYLANLADYTINITNNEGFGLTTAESVMAGTPIIVNVTGGLQDQCGFKMDGKLLTSDDYITINSIHDWRVWKDKVTWGDWAIPIWPKALSLAGSVPTPYIFDDRVDLYDVKNAILEAYNTPKTERKVNGLAGRDAFINELGLSSDNMCNCMMDAIETTLSEWQPKKRFQIYKIK